MYIVEKLNRSSGDVPKVSVIIPSYNVEKYISVSIDSVLNQTYPNVELVIVDDGSIDGTWDIIQKYANKNLNIIATKKKNEGVSSARNIGLKKSSGKYVLFLDADDWLENDAVEKLIKMVYDNPNCLICVDRYFAYNKEGKLVRERQTSGDEEIVISVQKSLIEVGTGKYNLQSSCYKIFDLAIIEKSDLCFDTNIHHGEDGLFVFQYLQYVDSIFYSTRPFWNILERENSATMAPYNNRWLSIIEPIDIMLTMNTYGLEVEKSLKEYRIKRILILAKAYFKSGKLERSDTKQIREYAKKSAADLGKLEISIKKKMALICICVCPSILLKLICK